MFKFTKKWKELTTSEISLRKNIEKNNTYFLELSDNVPIVVQMPRAEVVHGVSNTYKAGLTYLEIQFDSKHEDACELIESIERKIIKVIGSNGSVFFGGNESKLDTFALEEIFKHSFRRKNILRVRLDNMSQAFDKGNVVVDNLNKIEVGDEVNCSLYSSSVKISNGLIKINWHVCQLKINKVISDCILGESDSGSNNESDSGSDDSRFVRHLTDQRT